MKLLIFTLAVSILLTLTGCSAGENGATAGDLSLRSSASSGSEAFSQPEETSDSEASSQPEALGVGTVSGESEAVNREQSAGKELLHLENLSETESAVSLFLSEYTIEEPDIKSADLTIENLPEMSLHPYDDEPELWVFTDYIRQELGIEIDGRWKVYVHYYDMQQTVGGVQFLYTIGPIDTNRGILFNLSDGKADTVYCTHLDLSVDEEELLNRVELFESAYTQEQYELRDGETFEGSTVQYTYLYNIDRLFYTYNVFFSYGNGIISNDLGTECFIDQNGRIPQ